MRQLINLFSKTPLLIIFFSAFLFSGICFAGQAEQQQRLEQLKKEIKNLHSDIQGAKKQKNKLQQQLYSSEKEISQIISYLKSLNQNIKEKVEKLNALKWEEQRQSKDLKKNSLILAKQLRSSYATGRQEYMKLLLNQEDIYLLGRIISYYEYFGQARAKEIQAIKSSLEDIKSLRKVVWEKTGELEILRQEQTAKKARLEAGKKEKHIILAKLNRDIDFKGGRVKQLREDAQELEKFLERLRKVLADIPDQADGQLPFSKFKGQLSWPTQGRIKEKFGRRRQQGKMKWNGVIIDAGQGQSVRAIYHGRVVFSDWMRGYGMLLILDHGNGFMSLYGHNQSLFRNVGDWISAGEEIANVGNSGGNADSGLYFEIRHKGKPVNPALWCKR